MGEHDPEVGPGDGAYELEVELFALLHAGRIDEAHRRLLQAVAFFRPYLWRYAPELGGESGVEELLHDAVCQALERISSFRPGDGKLLNWVWTITMNLARDRIDEARARRDREQACARPEAASDPELEVVVHAAIARLDEPFRTILTLDLEHGGRAPIQLLMEALGAARQSIYNWRCEARKRLREELE